MQERVRQLNQAAPRADGAYVLYWAQMNRRVDANHALERAIQRANELAVPVLYYEGLTYDYPAANDRLHTFILEGVAETARRLAARSIGYCFYLRRGPQDPNDVFYRLAARACAVVTDDYPVFLAAGHNRRVPSRLEIPFEAVDASCIVPMRRFTRREYGAYTLRPKIRRLLPEFLVPCPATPVRRRWRDPALEFHTVVDAERIPALVANCAIDHTVQPSLRVRGGRLEAERTLDTFLNDNLRRYAREHNNPASKATSGLSPYLHFGQLSALEVALAVHAHAEAERLIADEFLEELIVRRELAFNYACNVEQPDAFSNLPDWAQKTLAAHAADRREPVYRRADFELGRTHDALFNACQQEMRLDGRIHGYYRMYWGKKIIEWSATPTEAMATMVAIHDRWALDGRDPATYTNIGWCFGLHDRPWAERPIFGMVRYMSLEGMKRKTDVAAYVDEMARRSGVAVRQNLEG